MTPTRVYQNLQSRGKTTGVKSNTNAKSTTGAVADNTRARGGAKTDAMQALADTKQASKPKRAPTGNTRGKDGTHSSLGP